MSLRAPFIMSAILSRRSAGCDRREHPSAVAAVAPERVEPGGLVLRAPGNVLDAPIAHARRDELGPHGGPQVDVRLVPTLGRDDSGAVGSQSDLLGHVAPHLEATRPDARPDRRHEARGARRSAGAEALDADPDHSGDDPTPA